MPVGWTLAIAERNRFCRLVMRYGVGRRFVAGIFREIRGYSEHEEWSYWCVCIQQCQLRAGFSALFWT